MSKYFLQSYVYSDHGNFFVSTCYRESSAMISPAWYYETFAWRLDENKKRTDWIADNSGASYVEAAYDQHFEVCKQLYRKGEFKEVEDE